MGYQGTLEQVLGIPFSSGNAVEVLRNGDEIFPAMLNAIQIAETSIDFLTFVYWTGDIADRFADALSNKAREGIKVRVLLDGYGAMPMDDQLIDEMERAGVEVVWFRPLLRWKIWKVDNRTHRKILICDNNTAFTGGVGIAHQWEGNARNPNEWRDTHFKITGPAVWGLKSAFIENWVEANDTLTNNLLSSKTLTPVGNTAIQIIRSSASVRWSDIMLLYQTLIKSAKEHIYLCTAYFNLNEVLVGELIERAKEGVEIKILLPGKHIDKRISQIAGEDSFEPLIKNGIQIYYYQRTMMHAKVLLVDDDISCVGSANFNQRSMMKDDEINLIIRDKQVNKTLTEHYNEDLTHAEQVTRQRWKRRGFHKKALEFLSRGIQQEV